MKRPTDYDEVLSFCPEAQVGACCNDIEEAAVEALFDSAGALTAECQVYYKQVGIRCVREIISTFR